MIRRHLALSLSAVLFCAAFMTSAGCKEERPRPALTAADNALLRAKADEKIAAIIRENLPALFAGVVVFRSDVFLYQSQMLDQANLSVLNVSGNTAILLLNSPDIPPLLNNDAVKKIFYLCRQGALPRLDDAFEMDMLRRFGQGKENDPVTFLVRFLEPPKEKDDALMKAAGYTVRAREGFVWTVTGPLLRIQRLLENDRITYYERASYQAGVPVTTDVPKATDP